MGQKANPVGLRLGITRTWDSRWYARNDKYIEKLHHDLKIRSFIGKKLANAAFGGLQIEHFNKKIHVTIHTAKPAIVVGRKGDGLNVIKKFIAELTTNEVLVNVVEIKKPELEASIVAADIARQLEARVSFKKAMKSALRSAMKMGALGVRINVSGRLGGAEIARMEWCREGRVPLHTLRAQIDYSTARANTTYGVIGVKVWIYKGDAKGIEY